MPPAPWGAEYTSRSMIIHKSSGTKILIPQWNHRSGLVLVRWVTGLRGTQSISPRAISEAGEPTQCRALNEHPARSRLEVRTRKRFGHNLKFILINQVARPLRFQHFYLSVVAFQARYDPTNLRAILYRPLAH